MPTHTTYPGVYVEELPSSIRSITTVTTSVTAFVGHTRRGPLNQPVQITSFADFERRFGGLTSQSPVAYAVHQFFGNGGTVAVIVRVTKADSGKEAQVTLESTEGHSQCPVLEVHAKEPGVWGSGLRVAVDHDTPAEGASGHPSPCETFNLQVLDAHGTARESFAGLSMDAGHGHFAETVINAGSSLIRVRVVGEGRPDPSGTVSKAFHRELPDLKVELTVKIGEVEREFTLYDPDCDGEPPCTVAELALLLEHKLRALPDAPGKHAFAGAEVTAFGRRIQVVAGSTDPCDVVRFVGECANDLGLEASVNPPVFPLCGGEDGEPPGPRDLIGSEARKSGLQALREVPDVNLLALPELASYESAEDMITVLSAAGRLCRERRIFLLVDAPAAWSGVDAARAGIAAFTPVRSNHSGLYFPHLQLTDPLTGRLRSFPPSGAVAGVIARTDSERGVWKAPAGTEARLAGVHSLSVRLTDRENGLLNPLGVNCLRTLPMVGPVIWGARTLEGADALDSEWKYVPVRRLALHVEESLLRGLQWVVFEPNTEQLWQQIRLNASAYLHSLFEKGAFKGSTPRQAYFVKCDKDTTTEADIDRGIVNVVVGIAPVKPAEFVIVKIQQMAGQFDV
ncbi:phage tail sheath subtilisin-like domain-containing protein [Streptomyces sp. Je 1-4]|uniref:phage tail sheath C-terminal domain-containing protein n=1 Tax=Streptomyces TaxID=1883 RepID=UPI0021D8070E|nr:MULTISPECIES: phage tail sheath C-terminal domain-containing protein [unclassified Streptomyces]UYB40418.1 phage tail sheath subtilisin-like domain-containing protein [Streptomyces sp. Je 1-4]UZQ36533.1 phage tail sheath subtilisin-like domain-containing protein [Streptomyces sp. Je 1-4] [Streptomyces sp. Je 1-4 4N24]UZQ43950.1 phage tail sheath subtilisin-like domain-containing protein [Streptomyces sp. Je 1-4] [Streptomyces sp. Je 1-4 4N24_ara]